MVDGLGQGLAVEQHHSVMAQHHHIACEIGADWRGLVGLEGGIGEEMGELRRPARNVGRVEEGDAGDLAAVSHQQAGLEAARLAQGFEIGADRGGLGHLGLAPGGFEARDQRRGEVRQGDRQGRRRLSL